jgi:signal peptidase I
MTTSDDSKQKADSDDKNQSKGGKEGIAETVRTVVYAVLIALVIRTLAYEPFNIPSGSMLPTLLIGDYIFVAKFPYGYSKHSLPFSPPILDGRIMESQVSRGDVAVFKLPTDNSTDYIKRIIGLPGDKIQMIGGILHINGEAVNKEPVDDFVYERSEGNYSRVRQFRETLPNGVQYFVLDLEANGMADNTDVYVVPAGHYFAMGDNRDDSTDSRFLNHVGFVPAENIVGRADIRFYSFSPHVRWYEVWKWPNAIRFGRLFSSVD